MSSFSETKLSQWLHLIMHLNYPPVVETLGIQRTVRQPVQQNCYAVRTFPNLIEELKGDRPTIPFSTLRNNILLSCHKAFDFLGVFNTF
jgi:hypothetical protein